MKPFIVLLFVGIFLASCSKDSGIKPDEKSDVAALLPDAPKSFDFNFVVGKLTVEYESGKKIVKNIRKDTLFTGRNNLAKSTAAFTTEDIGKDIVIDYADGAGAGDEFFASGTPFFIRVGATVLRNDLEEIISISNYHVIVTNPIVYYNSPTGGESIRKAEPMDVWGSAAPIPGHYVTATWSYYVNAKYIWSNGHVFTRKYSYTTEMIVV